MKLSDTWLVETMDPEGDPLEELARTVEWMAKSPDAGDYIREEGKENALILQRRGGSA